MVEYETIVDSGDGRAARHSRLRSYASVRPRQLMPSSSTLRLELFESWPGHHPAAEWPSRHHDFGISDLRRSTHGASAGARGFEQAMNLSPEDNRVWLQHCSSNDSSFMIVTISAAGPTGAAECGRMRHDRVPSGGGQC